MYLEHTFSEYLLSEDLKDRKLSTLLCLKRGLAEDVPKEEKGAPGQYTAVNVVQWFHVIRQRRLLVELPLSSPH
jgi:hypothetical protein